MVYLSGSALIDLLIIFTVLFISIYYYFKNAYKYWENRNIVTTPPIFPFGHIYPIFSGKYSLGQVLENIHLKLGQANKFSGIYLFASPYLIVHDPEEIKNVLVKDFSHFHDRLFYYNERDDPISAHLFAIEGKKWRDLRLKITPLFSSGKLKLLFPIILEQADQLNEYLKDISVNKNVDMKDVFARYTSDVIGSCGFGIDCNSFKNPDAPFKKYGQLVFKITYTKLIIFLFGSTYTKLARFLRLKLTRSEVSNFFTKTVKDTIKNREENNIRRKDFLDLMIQLKSTESSGKGNSQEVSKFTEKEIIAQAYVFFAAGFETSSSLMSFCLYELALNPGVQEKLRSEIKRTLVHYDGKMTYDSVMAIAYLEHVLNETLRKYPTVPLLTRLCTKDYILPGTDTIIKKGSRVYIPVRGLHHDPKYFPDPEKFDPDRFTEENKAKLQPFTFLPFGEGPRICIALRLGMLQTRLGVITTVLNFRVQKSEKTPVPLKLSTRNFPTIADGGVWLNLEPLE